MISFIERFPKTGLLCLLVFLLAVAGCLPAQAFSESIEAEAFKRLDTIREEKKRQLFDYMEKIERNANAIKEDVAMIDFFHLKNTYLRLQKTAPPPDLVVQKIDELKKKIREHYIRNYISFYDILFVDKSGDIFYTIRQEPDYHQNLFQGKLKNTSLAKQLQKNPEISFVDYQFYDVSGEPSAFIVVPVSKEAHLAGWFVFQCAINKINRMFSTEKGLGETGEVFLVNRERYMLTDSRFYGDSSILKQHLSSQNIMAKFNEKSGHKIVTDYRGFRALSSFEVCHIAGSEWLLIAKIDEDEIITEYYKKNRKELRPTLLKRLGSQILKRCDTTIQDGKIISVDMDEWRKSTHQENILTHGVSTCTAIIVSFTGKFAYLSHISNLDTLYGGTTTDLIGNIIKRIKTFDIYKYERRQLNIVVVAIHSDTILNAIDRFVDEGFFLSQIRFMFNDQAEYASLVHSCKNGQTVVEWLMNRETRETVRQCAESVQSASDLIKPLLFKNESSQFRESQNRD